MKQIKSIIALSITFIFTPSLVLATDVCTIIANAYDHTNSVRYSAQCTVSTDSEFTYPGSRNSNAKAKLIKGLIDKGYELKSENILVRQNIVE